MPELYLAHSVSEAEQALVTMLAERQPGFQVVEGIGLNAMFRAFKRIIHAQSDPNFNFNQKLQLTTDPEDGSRPHVDPFARDKRGLAVHRTDIGFGAVVMRLVSPDLTDFNSLAEADFEGPLFEGLIEPGRYTVFSEGINFLDGRRPIGPTWHDFGLQDRPGQEPRAWHRWTYAPQE